MTDQKLLIAARNAPEYIARENAVQERLKILGLEMMYSEPHGMFEDEETEEYPSNYFIGTSDRVHILREDLTIRDVEEYAEQMEKLFKDAARELDGAVIYIECDNSLFMTVDAPSNDQMQLFCDLEELDLEKQFIQYLEAQKAVA